MRCPKILSTVFVAALLAFSSVANAVVYDFGSLLTASSGYNAPDSFAGAPFASLAATDTGGGIWDFKLSINNNLFSSFGSSAFIGLMKFDFAPNPTGTITSTFLDSNTGGVTLVKSTSGDSSGGFGFDFGTSFGQGANNRLSQDDYVHWSVAGLDSGSSLSNMYLHVQGIDGGYSAKYTPVSPVPEPETYAMMLLGLGWIGFVARRRKEFKH